jgi:hypothetical protein
MHRVMIVVFLFVAGCASGRRAVPHCDQVPTGYVIGAGVLRNCEVDQRARVISSPAPDFSRLEPLVTSSAGCYQAAFALVVDEKGEVVPGSPKLIRTNSESYAAAISANIEGVRFQPAKKSGLPVRQFVEYEHKMQYRRSAGTMSSQRRPPPC